MLHRSPANRRGWIGSTLLIGTILVTGAALATWKIASIKRSNAAGANQPEPMEVVTAAIAVERPYRPTTTAIGTVLALQSITLSNEIAGTVRQVGLESGRTVEAGALLVALDVSVEKAALEAGTARAALAETTLKRLETLSRHQAVSQEEVDQARAARDVAQAQVAETRAIIARKTIRAPFRARVGIADVHPGQYLNEGTELTTLQGVADRGKRRLHRGAAGRGGAPGGRRRRGHRGERRVAGRRPDRGHRLAGGRHHAERLDPGADRGRQPGGGARRLGPGAGAGRPAGQGGGRSGERAPERAGGRSRLRAGDRQGRQAPRAAAAGAGRHGRGRHGAARGRPQARRAGGHVGLVQAARRGARVGREGGPRGRRAE